MFHSHSIEDFYSHQWRFYDLTRPLFLFGRQRLISAMSPISHSNVLEIGCGTGYNLLEIAKLRLSSGIVAGIDLSPHMLAVAKRKIDKRGISNVHLVHGSALQIPFGQSFDSLIFSYSLSMISSWREVLDTSTSLLRRGGLMGIVDFDPRLSEKTWAAPLCWWLRRCHVDVQRKEFFDVLGNYYKQCYLFHSSPTYYFLYIGEKR